MSALTTQFLISDTIDDRKLRKQMDCKCATHGIKKD